LGLVIDNSGSMRDMRARATNASLALVNSSNSQDEIFIVDFDDASYLDQPFTDDKQKLEAAILKSVSRGGSAMRDAISSSIEYSKSGKNETKALVVITDCDDNTSRHSTEELVKEAQDSGVAIYIVGLLSDHEPGKRRIALGSMRALAEGTGGADFYPKDQAELDEILIQLERQIRVRARSLR
jgi:Ca-activated chloride channel family protein